MKKHFTLAPIFKDNMVFQANKVIRIFGECKKGIEISISFLDQEIKFKTKTEEFLIELDAVPIQEKGFSFTLYTKKHEETFYNCLVGEVFLFAGGQNASLPLKDSYHEDNYDNCNVRILNLNKGLDKNLEFTNDIEWNICGRSCFEDVSALGYLFAKYLNAKVSVPIGIISCNHKDASVFSWLSNQDVSTHLVIDEYTKLAKANDIQPSLNTSKLYEELIKEIIPLSLKAVIFYQGESDYAHHSLYESAIIRIIKSYRMNFKDAGLPFVITQIAGYEYPEADDESISNIRLVQSALMDESNNIYIASAVDLGEEDNPCPKDKMAIAKRITNVVLEKLFKIGKNSISPTYYSYQHHKDGLVIYTQNNYLNLVSHSNQNLGFTYSVNGRDFFDIKHIEILNNRIVIKDIENIREIRYAFKKYPFCDIYTTNELPLLPFRIHLID